MFCSQNFFGFGQTADIKVELDGAEDRQKLPVKLEDGQVEKQPLYYDGETVSGKVSQQHCVVWCVCVVLGVLGVLFVYVLCVYVLIVCVCCLCVCVRVRVCVCIPFWVPVPVYKLPTLSVSIGPCAPAQPWQEAGTPGHHCGIPGTNWLVFQSFDWSVG